MMKLILHKPEKEVITSDIPQQTLHQDNAKELLPNIVYCKGIWLIPRKGGGGIYYRLAVTFLR